MVSHSTVLLPDPRLTSCTWQLQLVATWGSGLHARCAPVLFMPQRGHPAAWGSLFYTWRRPDQTSQAHAHLRGEKEIRGEGYPHTCAHSHDEPSWLPVESHFVYQFCRSISPLRFLPLACGRPVARTDLIDIAERGMEHFGCGGSHRLHPQIHLGLRGVRHRVAHKGDFRILVQHVAQPECTYRVCV